MLKNLKFLILLSICLSTIKAKPQFWKMVNLSEIDSFIFEVKSNMAAGICYKQVQAKANDPELRIRTESFCCPGYKRNLLSPNSVKCDPICSEDCNNGICSAPDVCECFPAYERKGGRCESIY